jgi:hypothetical protein
MKPQTEPVEGKWQVAVSADHAEVLQHEGETDNVGPQ